MILTTMQKYRYYSKQANISLLIYHLQVVFEPKQKYFGGLFCNQKKALLSGNRRTAFQVQRYSVFLFPPNFSAVFFIFFATLSHFCLLRRSSRLSPSFFPRSLSALTTASMLMSSATLSAALLRSSVPISLMYVSVVSMLVCPSALEMAASGSPLLTASDAHVCLATYEVRRALTPAISAILASALLYVRSRLWYFLTVCPSRVTMPKM